MCCMLQVWPVLIVALPSLGAAARPRFSMPALHLPAVFIQSRSSTAALIGLPAGSSMGQHVSLVLVYNRLGQQPQIRAALSEQLRWG